MILYPYNKKKEIKAEKMSLKFPKLKAANCIVAFLSSALQAFGMYNIHALSGVTEGGVLGATLLFDHWFGFPRRQQLRAEHRLLCAGVENLGQVLHRLFRHRRLRLFRQLRRLRAVPAPVAGNRKPSPSGFRGRRAVHRRRRGALRPGGRLPPPVTTPWP